MDMALNKLENPMFLNSYLDLESFFHSKKKKFYQTSFYIEQRKKLGILLDADGNPIGGKWSFDTENRKKYPAKKTAPIVQFPFKTSCPIISLNNISQI